MNGFDEILLPLDDLESGVIDAIVLASANFRLDSRLGKVRSCRSEAIVVTVRQNRSDDETAENSTLLGQVFRRKKLRQF